MTTPTIVPAQCWFRTFKIMCGNLSATCFVISRHDRQWIITAKHFTDDAAAAGGQLRIITHQGGDATITPELIPLVQPGADIAVFSIGDHKMVDDSLTLYTSTDGLILSQDVFVLGYPLPGQVPLDGTIPFVKRGLASQKTEINGVHVWWIDALNNPGFSGGPVVFRLGAGIAGNKWHVLGVVSAYVTQAIAVTGGGQGIIPTNSGIMLVYDIRHAIEAIDAFMGASPTETAAQTV